MVREKNVLLGIEKSPTESGFGGPEDDERIYKAGDSGRRREKLTIGREYSLKKGGQGGEFPTESMGLDCSQNGRIRRRTCKNLSFVKKS